MMEFAKTFNEKINLRNYIDGQLEFFIEKFKENGWKQEDTHYVTMKTDLQDWDLGIVFYSEILEYEEEGRDVLTPWIVGRLEVEETDYSKLIKYARFILSELDEMGIKPFHDEDSFHGYFAKHENKGWTEIKFYINKEYPDGYWENHTL